MNYRIFNVRTDILPCDCTRGCTDIVRVCTKSGLWEKSHLPHRGIEPASAASDVYKRQVKDSYDGVVLPSLRCMLGVLVFSYSTEL